MIFYIGELFSFLAAVCLGYSTFKKNKNKMIFWQIIDSILNCIANPIWAFCVDKFGFRPIMLIISIITTVLSIYLSIFIDIPIFYVIGIYVSNTLRGGIIAAFIPHMMEIFGIKYFLPASII